MEKSCIYVCNTVLSGDIPPLHLNEFLQRVLKYGIDIWSCLDHPRVYQVPLVSTMMVGKVNELRVFLRYGLEKTTSRMLQLSRFIHVINEAINRNGKQRTASISMTDIERFLRNVDAPTERRRRLVIETFAVASLLHTGHVFSHPISLCFEMAWKATAEPFVKQREMLQTMVLLCGTVAEDGISDVCETYVSKLGEVTEGPIQPRTLKHLCRCTIRRALTKTFRLPHSIDDLNLPDTLKKYVRLET